MWITCTSVEEICFFYVSFYSRRSRKPSTFSVPPYTCFQRDEIQRLLSLRLLSSNQRSPFFVKDFDLKLHIRRRQSKQHANCKTTRGKFKCSIIILLFVSRVLSLLLFQLHRLIFEFEPPWYCTLSTLTDHVRFVVQLQASSEQERIERREFTFFLLSFQRVGPLFGTGEISIHLPKPLMSPHTSTNYMLYTAANFVAGLPILIHRLIVRSPMSFATLRESVCELCVSRYQVRRSIYRERRELCFFVQHSRFQL